MARKAAVQTALTLALLLRSMARFLAEWAGMHKRIEIVVRNPGYEGTEQAMGVLTLDFQDQQVFETQKNWRHSRITMRIKDHELAYILENEKGECQGFNPEYYVSHRIGEALDWQPPWLLPAQGTSAPRREDD